MTEDKSLKPLLQEHPFFKDFDDQALDLLVSCARNERFDAGQYMYREGTPADRFYLVRHGTVAMEIRIPGREPIILETVHAGDVIGWSWIVPPYRWRSDGRATELVRAISMDAKCLREKCEADHSLGYQFYRRIAPVIADRFGAMRLRLADIYAPLSRIEATSPQIVE